MIQFLTLVLVLPFAGVLLALSLAAVCLCTVVYPLCELIVFVRRLCA